MFGFNKKDRVTRDYDNYETLYKAIKEANKPYYDWLETEDCKRLNHLQTLIIKTYETVGIRTEGVVGTRLDRSFTRSDYMEDFKVFFKPDVFDKLKDWCKEYEMLREKEKKVFENL